jgi:hypothetical protein
MAGLEALEAGELWAAMEPYSAPKTLKRKFCRGEVGGGQGSIRGCQWGGKFRWVDGEVSTQEKVMLRKSKLGIASGVSS